MSIRTLLSIAFLTTLVTTCWARDTRSPQIKKWNSQVASGQIVTSEESPAKRSEDRMHRLLGVTVDKDGQLVFVGERHSTRDRKLAKFGLTRHELLDIFATALRAEMSGESAGVTIDEVKGGGLRPHEMMPVRYFGQGVKGTALGFILFEADRLMKCLSCGFDNQTYRPIPIPQGMVHLTLAHIRFQQIVGDPRTAQVSGGMNRFWFMPTKSSLVFSDNESVATFVSSVMVDTEQMALRVGGPAQGTGTKDPASVIFANQMTRNLDTYAKHNEIFVYLRESAKLVLLARAIVQEDLPEPFANFNPGEFLQSNQPITFPTPNETPAIVTPWKYRFDGGAVEIQLVGGVDLTPRGNMPANATKEQQQEAFGKVHVGRFGEETRDSDLNPNHYTNLDPAKPPRLSNKRTTILFPVAEQSGVQVATVTDYTNGPASLGRRRRSQSKDDQGRRDRRFQVLLDRVQASESRPSSEVRSDGSFGGGWDLIAPSLTIGKDATWRSNDGRAVKMPGSITLSRTGQSAVVFDQGVVTNRGFMFSSSKSPGHELHVIAQGRYRYNRGKIDAEFDDLGRLTTYNEVEVKRDSKGRIEGFEVGGTRVRHFRYSKDELTRVEDAEGRFEEYGYRNGEVNSVKDSSGDLLRTPTNVQFVAVEFSRQSLVLRRSEQEPYSVDLSKQTIEQIRPKLVEYLRRVKGDGAQVVALIHSESVAEVELLQQQHWLNKQLVGTGIHVVSTSPGRATRAGANLRAATRLRAIHDGKTNIAVVADPKSFHSKSQRAVEELTRPSGIKESNWNTDHAQPIGSADGVIELAENTRQWVDSIAVRGARGDFRGKHVLLLLSDPVYDVRGADQFGTTLQAAARMADKFLDQGAVLVTGYFVNVPLAKSEIIIREYGQEAERSTTESDVTPQDLEEQVFKRLRKKYENKDLKDAFNRLDVNRFKRAETKPRRRGGAPGITRSVLT